MDWRLLLGIVAGAVVGSVAILYGFGGGLCFYYYVHRRGQSSSLFDGLHGTARPLATPEQG